MAITSQKRAHPFQASICLILFSLALSACGANPGGFGTQVSGAGSANTGLGQPSPGNQVPPPATPTPGPTPSPVISKAEVPPLWEAARPTDGKDWTAYASQIVLQYGDALLQGTSDIKTFCPSYFTMTTDEKVNFWVYLVSGVVKYESGFSPTSRYEETTMGTDPVTGQPVWSEGLLQLSYQDVRSYSFCAEDIDWNADKNLSAKDPAKTILDPHRNLRCGIRILNQQVKRTDLIAVRGYWSTLFPDGTHSKVSPIRALTTQLSFCR